jgi:SAM-dependent methyltransferase
MNSIALFFAELKNSLNNDSFVKLNLGNYKGLEEGLKAIYVKNVVIKQQPKLSFTYRYKTKDIVKNYPFDEAMLLLENAVNEHGFRFLTLFTLDFDLSIEWQKNGEFKSIKKSASSTSQPTTSHDRQKNRKIEARGQQYLTELKITDTEGNVFKNAQDKYRQINHYVEILSSLLDDLPQKENINVVDMGAGKGYLTFAIYDYLTNILQRTTTVTGVEFRKDLVELCNQIARKSSFDGLNFVEGTIESYENPSIDVLIALHACDTATDDAIAQGIRNNADLIVVAPCCHKQIRREIEKHRASNELDFLLRYGTFLERQAEMVTDGIRALVLEYFGYSTKVFEFISDSHTPKNVLVVGQKKKALSDEEKAEISNKLKATKAYFGIGFHHLERIMELA